jgi:hypothetical protein
MVIHKILIFIFIILPEFAAAKAFPRQDDSLSKRYKFCGIGVRYYRIPLASVNAFLQSQYNATAFNNVLPAVGLELGVSDLFVISNLRRTLSRLSLHFYQPQVISTATASFKLSGAELYADVYSGDFIASNQLNLSLGLAWCFGRFQITQTDITGTTTFSNPYFIPVLQTEGNVILFKRMLIGIRYFYRHDWSKTGWKRKSGNATDLPGTRLSGGSANAFLAWTF